MSAPHRELELKVPSYQLSNVFSEGGKEKRGDRKVGGVCSMGTNWQGVYDTLGFLYFSVKRFDRTRVCVCVSMCALAHLCTPVYPRLCGNVTLSSVCLCVCV